MILKRVEYLADFVWHVPTVAAWQHAQFGYLSPAVTLEQRVARLAKSLQKGQLPTTLIALCEDGTLLGSASIVQTTLTHKHLSPWLSAVFVPPEHRCKGVASALSLRAAAICADMGFERLYLFTPHNASLYARLGWKTCDTVRHQGTPITIMARDGNLTSGGADNGSHDRENEDDEQRAGLGMVEYHVEHEAGGDQQIREIP